jgi:hypothetical protein
VSDPHDPGESGPGLRLVFAYSGSEIRLIQQTQVSTVPPPVGVASTAEVEFVEVRDENDRALARVPVHPAMNAGLEVFPENHDDPIVRADAPAAEGAFTVVIPAPAAARRVGVLRQDGAGAPRPGPGAPPPAAPQVLGVFDLEGR